MVLMLDSVGQRAVEGMYLMLNRPDAPFRLEKEMDSLSIVPLAVNTFPITIANDEGEAYVAACSWHDHFTDGEQAGGCVMGLLSPYYRIVEQLDGDQVVWTHIERYQAEGWVQIGAGVGPHEYWLKSGVMIPRTGKRQIHQQAVILPPWWAERFPGVVLEENGFPPGSVMGTRIEKDD